VAEDDFDLGGFDEAYSPDDFSQADMDFATAVGMQSSNRGSDDDSSAQFIANQFAQPQAGMNRSNITNLVNSSGNSLYDPTFAAALDISRGLDPTNNMGGTGGLAVPSYLRPQVPGNKVLNEAGDRMMYGSPVERFFQEDLTDAIRSAQESGIGIPSLLGKGLDALLGGIDFLSNSKAGSKIEDVFEEQKKLQGPPLPPSQFDQFGNMVRSSIFDYSGNPTEPLSVVQNRRNKIEDLQQEASREAQLREIGFNPDFKTSTFPSITKTDLDPAFMNVDKTTANLPPDPVLVNQIQRDIAKSRGIFDLAQAADLQNQQIAAGNNLGYSLSSPYPKEERKEVQGPPRPSEKAPPGFVDIVMREDQNPVFAGTNMSIFGGRDPSAKAYTPLTEAEALASDFTGFTLEPFSPMFEKTYDPRDYTASGVLTGVNLPAAEFRVGKSEPEKVKRVAISSLPPIAQGINALRSDFDISSRVPISMQTIIDGARAVERGDFSQQEMADFLGGFGRYAK
jgi:hypothetical protein